jgi:uncharacterized protein YjdB
MGFNRRVLRVSGAAVLTAIVSFTADAQSYARRGAAREGSGVTTSQTPIDHIVISPASKTLFTGMTLAHTARGVLRDGTERKLLPVWRSSNPEIATVDRAGNVTARKVGIVTITAESEGVRGTKTYAITKKPAEKILIDLPGKPIRSGDIV